jgi:pimeloyl-ACP methyl ester carboxylesterase
MSKKRKDPLPLRIVRWWFPKLEKMAQPLATRLFVQLFFTPLQYGFQEKELEWVHKASLFSFLVNGRKVQAYSWGEESHPVVLFIHGWAGRATQFRKFFPPLLKAGFRVVAFDGPAHGKSEGKRTNILEFRTALEQMIKLVGVPQSTVAHSFGGTVALFGNSEGLPIKKLINIGSPVIGDKIIETFLKAVNGNWNTGLKFKAYMIKKYKRSFEEFSGQHFIQQIKTPISILLVHDDQDKDVSIDHPLELIRLYPQAKLYKTSGLGHVRILKDETVIQDCLKFIQSEG